jgi:hypothetical protein
MSWTFGAASFDWLAQDVNGLPARASWVRKPILVQRPLLGTGDADIARVGYEAWSISGGIIVSAANAALLAALNGEQATLSDGTSSWVAVATINLADLNDPTEGATGQATFVRARA